MKALIERYSAAEDSRIGEIEAGLGAVPDAAIRARLASELRDLTDEDRSVALSLRSEEHTSELQSLMRNSYAVFCLKKKKTTTNNSTFNCYIHIQCYTVLTNTFNELYNTVIN